MPSRPPLTRSVAAMLTSMRRTSLFGLAALAAALFLNAAPASAGPRSVPVLTNPRNAGEAALDCNTTYKGFRMCDWLRPDHSPY
jgi:hypothetical protein